MPDPMQLSAGDYQELQAHGPTGLTEDQYFPLVNAVERIKGAAFQDGQRAERERQRAREELTNAKADIAHAHTDAPALVAAIAARESAAEAAAERDRLKAQVEAVRAYVESVPDDCCCTGCSQCSFHAHYKPEILRALGGAE